jgi:hypothetical protein
MPDEHALVDVENVCVVSTNPWISPTTALRVVAHGDELGAISR